MDSWLNRLTDLQTMSAGGIYLVVITLVFVECGVVIGFLFPGDTVLFGSGLLAARPGSGLWLPALAGGVFVAAVAGEAVGYWSGRRWGRPWLLRRAGRAAAHVERAEMFYQRWGGAAVVTARFVPWARTFVPILAGVARMPYRRFMTANVLGAAAWGVGLEVTGYLAYDNPTVRRAAYLIAGTAIAVSIAVPVSAAVRRARGRRARGRPPAVPPEEFRRPG